MSFAHPLFLLALAPLLLVAAPLFWRAAGHAPPPGDWRRLMDPALIRICGPKTPRGRGARMICGLAALALIVALARPVFDKSPTPPPQGLAGRVLAIELLPEAEMARQRLAAKAFLDDAPLTPTAIVAVSGNAYEITPTTTDRAYLERYLSVLAAELSPTAGRSDPALGLRRAEALLERAGYAVGQTVYLAASPPAEGGAPEAPKEGRLRAILTDPAYQDAWRDRADAWGARLGAAGDPASALGDLHRLATLREADLAGSQALDLRSWLVALAAAFWLILFRRRRAE